MSRVKSSHVSRRTRSRVPGTVLLLFALSCSSEGCDRSIRRTGSAALDPLPANGTASTQTPVVFLPVDESSNDASLAAFLRDLTQTVRRRDVAALLAVLDPEITNSFGGEGGLEEFKAQWQPSSSQSTLWTELESILALGGAFMGPAEYCAPYVVVRFPESRDERAAALVKANVAIHSDPTTESPIVATASHAIVELLPGNEPPGWTHVKVVGLGSGHVRSDEVRSPLDWRLCMTRRGDRWAITALVRGD